VEEKPKVEIKPKVEEPKKIVETETAGKEEFSVEVTQKAKILSEFLPQYTYEFLCEAVQSAGNVDLEDLMANLM